jgi:WD40 repeat protein
VVYAFRFSPDGATLAIARRAGEYGRVELWDTEAGVLRHVIKGFDGPVWSVSFAPDGKTLVTGGRGFHGTNPRDDLRPGGGRRFNELKWWDVQTGDLKRQMELPGEDKVSVAALHSPDGKMLATVEYHSMITLANVYINPPWDPYGFDRSQLRMPIPMAYSADLKLLDTRTGEVIVKLKNSPNSYEMPSMVGFFTPDLQSMMLTNQLRQPFGFSPDGRLVAAWNAKEVRLWDTATGQEVRKLKDFKGALSAVAFSPDSHSLAAAITKTSLKKDRLFFNSEIRLFDLTSGAVTQTLPITTRSISGVAFAPNGRQFLISGLQMEQDHLFPTLELADIQTGISNKLLGKLEGTVSSVVLSPNGHTLAFQSDASTVQLVDMQTWKIKHTYDDSSDASSVDTAIRGRLLLVKSVLALAFSRDSKTVTGEVEQSGIKVWDTRTGEVKKEITDHEDASSIVEISSNGTVAAEVGEDNLRLWNLGRGEKKTVPTPGGTISAIALSPDGQIVAIAHPNQIMLLNTGTGELVQALSGQPAQQSKISCMTFSADGRALATAEGIRIEIWDLTTGQIKRTMTSAGNVTALSFAPDGRTFASAAGDGSVSLWDLQTGTLGLHLKKHSAAVNAIAFSNAGDLMATGGDDRSVIIWDTATGKARRTLKGHDLTVTSLAFSPDTSLLASGSGNASVVLWDVKSGTLNRVLR